MDHPPALRSVAEAAEPNDTAATATDLGEPPVKAAGELDSGEDRDWCAFTATEAMEQVNVATFSREEGPDTYLRILDASGATALAEDDNSGFGYLARIYGFPVIAGETYIIEVSSPPEWPWIGTYDLLVEAIECLPGEVPDGRRLWINEVYSAPDALAGEDSENDEYIEIVHDLTIGEPGNLSDFALRDSMSPKHVFACGSMMPVRPAGLLARAAVIFGKAGRAIAPQGDPLVQTASEGGGFGLNNDGDVAILVDARGYDLDRFAYPSTSTGVSRRRCGDSPDGEIKRHYSCGPGLPNRSPGRKQDLTDFNP